MQKIFLLIRLAENNDWVVFIILGAILVFIMVLQYLQREAGLVAFFTQNFIDSSNIFPTWLVVSVVYTVLLATYFSQFIPLVPKVAEQVSPFGYSLNKFGFALLGISVFYFIRFFLTFFFYSSIGQDKKWGKLYFVSSKFYFAVSILLIIAIITNYYFDINRLLLLKISLFFVIFIFIFKNLFFAFNKNYILPNEWYYKFLYICTLQFAPLLALWKLLFF